MTEYRYQQLADPGGEIRVAVLHPGEFADEIHVTFETCSLHVSNSISGSDLEPETTFSKMKCSSLLIPRKNQWIEYEALSYVWGSQADPAHARIFSPASGLPERGIVSITQNLEIALRHLRQAATSRRLWIDALCIDQRDNKERSTQVSIMGKIYASADRVIAWLGEDANGSEEALVLLQHASEQVQIINRHTLEMRPVGENSARWADRGTPIPWQRDQFRAVYALLSRPYFGRVWIQQEVQLATTVVFQCGNSVVKEHDIWPSLSCLSFKPVPIQMLAPISEKNWLEVVVRVMNAGRNRLQPRSVGTPLVAIRHRVRDLSCQDPRDKLYAFLGLLGDQDKSLEIVPDYSRPVEDVYTDIVRRKATAHRSLDLLCSCELSSRLLEVPSWCPDWSAPLKTVVLPVYGWSACGFISASVSFSEKECTASGLIVSRVSTTHLYSTNPLKDRAEAFFEFMESIKPSLRRSTDLYKTTQGIAEAYCRTLTEDRMSDQDYPVNSQLSMEQCRMFLEAIWWEDDDTEGAFKQVDQSQITGYMIAIASALEGACFVTTSCGYIGIAPATTRAGDVISILFGCHKPLVLRPVKGTDDGALDQKYLVVGSCYIHGLMNGEFIYQEPDPLRYKLFAQNAQHVSLIDGYMGVLFDRKQQTWARTPTEPLRNSGIEVQSYVRDPHRLIVLPEILREAGLAVEDFVLI